MRQYVVTFWDPANRGWPVVEAALKAKEAVYVVVSVLNESTVVECPESTALIMRDHEEVHSLLPVKPKK